MPPPMMSRIRRCFTWDARSRGSPEASITARTRGVKRCAFRGAAMRPAHRTPVCLYKAPVRMVSKASTARFGGEQGKIWPTPGYFAALAAVVAFGATALATVDDPTLDCLSEDNGRRISGCSAMIDTPGLPDDQRSLAYGMRALAYSLLGIFDKALADYDEALRIKPDFPLALNNRAWAYYKLGRPGEGSATCKRRSSYRPAARMRSIPAPTSTRRRAMPMRRSRTTSGPCGGRRAHRENVPVRPSLAGPLFRGRRRRLYLRCSRLCARAPAIASAIHCPPIQNAAPKSLEAVHDHL